MEHLRKSLKLGRGSDRGAPEHDSRNPHTIPPPTSPRLRSPLSPRKRSSTVEEHREVDNDKDNSNERISRLLRTEQEVMEQWERPSNRLLIQLGTDLPRLCGRIVILDAKDNRMNEIDDLPEEEEEDEDENGKEKESGNEKEKEKEIEKNNGHMIAKSPPSSPQSSSLLSRSPPESPSKDKDTKSTLPVLRHLKSLLLCLTENVEEDGKQSDSYKRIEESFDKHFEGIYHDNVQQEVSDLIEKIVLADSKVGKILKTCTQGHIAPCSTNLKVMLGLENLTKDVNGSWRIIIAIRTDHIVVTHLKREICIMGQFELGWRLKVIIDRGVESIQSVTFHVDDLHFKPEISEQRKEGIVRCLSPYFGPILQAGDCDSLALVGEGILPHSFPYSVFSLSHLTSLHLDNNYLGRKSNNTPQQPQQQQPQQPLQLYDSQMLRATTPTTPAAFFDALASHLTALRTLTLSNNQLRTFPLALCKLSSLSFLALNKNNITTLPTNITTLTSLETLSLAHNRITVVPPEIAKLRNLKSLNLAANQLKALSAALSSLPKLDRLEIQNNPFEGPYEILLEFHDTPTIIKWLNKNWVYDNENWAKKN